MTTVAQPLSLLEESARRNGRQLAFTDGSRSVNVADLLTTVKRMSTALRERGVKPGEIIAFNLTPVAAVPFSLVANHEGLVQTSWVTDFAANNWLGISWLATHHLIDGFPADRQIVVDNAFYSSVARATENIDPRMFDSADALFRISLSSGTTGRPKAVGLSLGHTLARATQSVSRWADKGPFLSLLLPRTGVGWHAWFESLVRGDPYLIAADTRSAVTIVNEYGVESLLGTPVNLTDFTRYAHGIGASFPTLRRATSVGAAASEQLARNFRSVFGVGVGNVYSSTEFGGVATRRGESFDANFMGQLIPQVELEIVDPGTHDVLGRGEVGLIRVRRPGMVTEYLGDPDATSTAFRDGWFYPGDLGFIGTDGLHLAGRFSEIINASGAKIDPAYIDRVFMELDEVDDCAAFAVTAEFGLTAVGIAYVSATPLDERELRASRQEILGAAAPVIYHRVDEIPRGETGKPLRAELSARFSAT